MKRTRLQRLLKALASIKLAVIVILLLAGLTAIGTFTESRYDALTAQKLVYHSPYMIATLLLLAVNLTAVMVDRWPWRRRHVGFVLAHIGILLLLAGAWITKEWGVDGTLRLEIGGANRFASVAPTDFVIYATYDGDNYRTVVSQEVDFLVHPPSPSRPVSFSLPDGELVITDYYPYAEERGRMVASSSDRDGAAVRFQLQNAQANVTQWLRQRKMAQPETAQMGPLSVVLTRGAYTPAKRNEVVLKPKSDTLLELEVFDKTGARKLQKSVQMGSLIETPWMGMTLRIVDYIPHAIEELKYTAVETPGELTTSAIQFRFANKEHWVGKNALLKLFTNQAAYVVSYQNRLINLGFDLRLKDFQVGRYPGTMRASSYASRVDIPGQGEVTIAMNEPLRYKGYTFYQASFEESEPGHPTASILSVNYDPGRSLKYLGCFLIVAGSLWMFYLKRRVQQAQKKAQAEATAEPFVDRVKEMG